MNAMEQRHNRLMHRLGFTIVAVIFLLLMGKHYDIDYRFVFDALENVERRVIVFANEEDIIDSCGSLSFVSVAPDTYICTEGGEEEIYDYIFQTYPASIKGKEEIYSFLSDGERDKADSLLGNVFDLERYEPSKLTFPLTWTEDPYDERYWRFLFYSLRPVRHLLAAGLETGDPKYFDKLREITGGFVDEGMDEIHAWDDIHASAFRTMMLVNIWWKLREEQQLPEDFSEKILRALPVHAAFLMEPLNFERDNNHGITEAGALLVLGEVFPDLPGAHEWRETGRQRMIETMENIVDPDGVLTENSPYYHFYSLEKFWEIYKYSHEHDIAISRDFDLRVEKMFRYATHILQPDSHPPLIGASIPREIRKTGEFREIAEVYPPFDFVLTQGRNGTRPEERNVVFPSSGQVIMRSEWGRGGKFDDVTQLVFDMGPYRTDHSELDALNFQLYAQGDMIIRDTGLFTYETNNPYFNYFYGTRGHNTVIVDGENQDRGEPVAGEFRESEDWAWQSAYHSLYDDVVHHRAISLLGDDILLIIDELDGTVEHEYEQLFHLGIGTTIDRRGLRVVGKTLEHDISLRIEQILKEGISIDVHEGDEDAVRGFCATAYELLEPCPEISYKQEGVNGRYITLVSIGDAPIEYEYVENEEGGRVVLRKERVEYTIDISYTSSGRERHILLDIEQSENEDDSLIDSIGHFFKRIF